MKDLKSLIVETQAALRDDPTKAMATFASRSGLKSGFESEVKVRNHRITVDEPEALGGTDKGPNPVELVLAALGTCQEIAYRTHAAALGVPLDSVRVELEGDLDLRGFFAVDESIRPGYRGIRGTVHLRSSADPASLERLRRHVDAHCPVLDIISNPVPVDLEIATEQAAEEKVAI